MKYYSILVLLFSITLSACNSDVEESKEKKVETTVPQTLPMVGDEIVSYVYANATAVDVQFERPSSFSMNSEGQQPVQTFLSLMEKQPAIDKGCLANGRIYFQGDGEILLEMDFFVDDGCAYIKCYYNGQTYLNKANPQGVEFIRKQIEQVEVSKKDKIKEMQGGN